MVLGEAMGADRKAAVATPDRPRTLRAAELAWVVLLPCAALVLAAIVVLGPLVGRLAFPSSGLTFFE